MSRLSPESLFNQDHAAAYDDRFSKLGALRDALHLITRFLLSQLPADARILCVGAGTGAEIAYLAEAFPGWRFTAVEPAPAMLAVCRQKMEDRGFAQRCDFHEGYLETLPTSQPYDAATSLLVSQFLLDIDERKAFFRGIAGRLRPKALLVAADLASEHGTDSADPLFVGWWEAMNHSSAGGKQFDEYRANMDRHVAILPPSEVESIIATSGFERPVEIFQTLLIHGWLARKAS